MSICIGDHLIIKRKGLILGMEDETYHEFVVTKEPSSRYLAIDELGHPHANSLLVYEVTLQFVQ